MVESGTPIKSIADSWGVSRTTIYRYINKPELLVDYLAMTWYPIEYIRVFRISVVKSFIWKSSFLWMCCGNSILQKGLPFFYLHKIFYTLLLEVSEWKLYNEECENVHLL